jgi:ABC-type lipoprotein release transport system permease subunit
LDASRAQVSRPDAAGYAAVAVILDGIALASTWLPAWRGSAVDPVVALRKE